MFYSHSFLSRKGPLAAIWLAAYCFKRLKKAQVTQTDISYSVDRILRDEFDVVTYRVLAYLLLGIVRIFSKKVEYLFDDCNKVLLKIKDFVVSTKERALVQTLRAPYFSITLPERFELDAFDLEILEDTSGGNVMPYEDITLKDAVWKAGARMAYSLDKHFFPEFTIDQDIISGNYIMNDDLSSHLVDFDMVVDKSHNLSSSQSSTEKFQGSRSTQCEAMELEILPTVEEGPLIPGRSLDEDGHTVAMEVVDSDEMHAEPSMYEVWDNSIFLEAGLNLQIFNEVNEEYDAAKSFGKHNQTDGEEIKKIPETAQLQNENQAVIEEHCDMSNLEASMEKIREDAVAQEERMDVEIFCRAEEPPEQNRSSDEKYQSNLEQKIIEVDGSLENIRPFAEEQQNSKEQQTLLEIASPQNRMYLASTEDHPLSVTLDTTPLSKIGYPHASGITTLELSVIRTPASKEGARVSRKRKCVFDDMIVFPNNVFKHFMEDASDLVAKRKKVPCTALAAWRASQVSHLPRCFLESLIPCASLDLRSLISGKKINISESLDTVRVAQTFTSDYPAVRISVETVESSELDKSKPKNDSSLKLNVPASPVVHRQGETAEPANCDMQVSPRADRSLEQAPIAPETPILRTKSLRSIESPEGPGISNLDVSRLESAREAKEPSPSNEHYLDLSMMDEEITSCERDDENQYGWSGRTRLAVRYLRRTFLNHRKRREDEVANLLRLLKGRTKKESARLFYEILVLKSKGYVQLKQENAYGEILIWKASHWGQSFGEDDAAEVPRICMRSDL